MAKTMGLVTEIRLDHINLEVISLSARKGVAEKEIADRDEPGVKRCVASVEVAACEAQIVALEKAAQKIFSDHQ